MRLLDAQYFAILWHIFRFMRYVPTYRRTYVVAVVSGEGGVCV